MQYEYLVSVFAKGDFGRLCMTADEPITSEQHIKDLEAQIEQETGKESVVVNGFFLLKQVEDVPKQSEDAWQLTVSHDDTKGYTITGLTHEQMRGLDLLLSYNHTGNRTRPVPMDAKRRIECDQLLDALLPVVGGLQKTNTVTID